MVIFDKYKFLDVVLDLIHEEVFRYLVVMGLCENVLIFGADMSSSVHAYNKKNIS